MACVRRLKRLKQIKLKSIVRVKCSKTLSGAKKRFKLLPSGILLRTKGGAEHNNRKRSSSNLDIKKNLAIAHNRKILEYRLHVN